MKQSVLILSLIFVFASCGQSDSSGTDTDASQTDSSNVEAADDKEETGVFFKNIAELDTLTSPFVIEMGINGMLVEPKGPVEEGSGHHHLLINDGPFEKGKFIAPDSTHIHYGGAETVDTVSLAPGKYLLTLQFGDGAHMSYGEEWAKSITVYVK